MENTYIDYNKPTLNEYQNLRKSVGWDNLDDVTTLRSIENTVKFILVRRRNDNKLIALARIIGDYGLYYYIQDVAVIPEYQGRGIGSLLMNEVSRFISNKIDKGAFIGLFAVSGTESFYRKFGFKEIKQKNIGMGFYK